MTRSYSGLQGTKKMLWPLQIGSRKARDKPDCRAAPAGFEYHRNELGKDPWVDGLIRMVGDADTLDASDLTKRSHSCEGGKFTA